MWNPRYHYNYCEAAQDAILDLEHGEDIGIYVIYFGFFFFSIYWLPLSDHAGYVTSALKPYRAECGNSLPVHA